MQLISFVALTILTLWSISVDCEQCSLIKWTQFKERFGKKYESLAEDNRRQHIFCRRLRLISEHNKRNLAYKLALNHFADQPDQELGLVDSSPHPTTVFPEATKEQVETSLVSDEPPFELDWSKDPRVVGPVKNQGRCNASWLFAAVALLEAQEHKLIPNLSQVIPLSEQQVIDCDPHFTGCFADYNEFDGEYIRSFGGLEAEAEYRYDEGAEGKRGHCKADASLVQSLPLTSFLGFGYRPESTLKNYVARFGPVAVTIRVPQDFRFYSEGIIYDPDCAEVNKFQSLLLVGYGTDQATGQDYWLLKNSWGTSWGMKGYVRLARNRDNQCDITNWPYIAKLSYTT